MSSSSSADALANREHWDAKADDYQAAHAEFIAARAALGCLADAGGGAAGPRRRRRQGRARARLRRGRVVALLARRGARATGLDNSARQLEHARRAVAERGLEVPLVHASAECVPLAGRELRRRVLRPRRDDLRRPATATVPEVARLLRPGGLLAFCARGPLCWLCWTRRRTWLGPRSSGDYFGHAPLRRPTRRDGHGRLQPRRTASEIRLVPRPDGARRSRTGWSEVPARIRKARQRSTYARPSARRRPWARPLARCEADLEAAPQGARVSAPPAPPLLLASTSPQRRAILEQLGIPFDVVRAALRGARPARAPTPSSSCASMRAGKARSVADGAGDRPVLGVDTAVVLGGRVYGKPADADGGGARCWRRSPGATHEVVSGLCLRHAGLGGGRRTRRRASRSGSSTPRDLAAYVASGEWEGRAGGYAIQGRGAALVERIEGDYLNVVGLPAALLVRLLATRFPGVYGFG